MMSDFPITDATYIADRLDTQYEWFERKASWNQSRYKWLRMSEIAAAALIPVLSSVPADRLLPGAQWLVPALGILIALIAGVMGLFKFNENWIQYRTTAELLKHEKFLYTTQCNHYAGEDRFSVLVQRVEKILMKENATWTQAASTPAGTDSKTSAPAQDGGNAAPRLASSAAK
jgi:hypothetical protein